jgi:dihydropyrimidine dehydrogenase (NAD+) subunit PreA
LGSSLVQVCTAAMWSGFEIIEKMTRRLLQYMESHNFSTIDDFKGKVLKKIGPYDVIDLNVKLKAVINEETCTGCEICVKACDSGAFEAIDMVGKVARVNEKCDGCGLCIGLCPVNCISMIPA